VGFPVVRAIIPGLSFQDDEDGLSIRRLNHLIQYMTDHKLLGSTTMEPFILTVLLTSQYLNPSKGISAAEIAIIINDPDVNGLINFLHALVKQEKLVSYIVPTPELDEKSREELQRLYTSYYADKIPPLEFIAQEKEIYAKRGAERFCFNFQRYDTKISQNAVLEPIMEDSKKLKKYACSLTHLFLDDIQPTLISACDDLKSFLKLSGKNKPINRWLAQCEKKLDAIQQNALFKKISNADRGIVGSAEDIDLATIHEFLLLMNKHIELMLQLTNFSFDVDRYPIKDSSALLMILHFVDKIKAAHAQFIFTGKICSLIAPEIERRMELSKVSYLITLPSQTTDSPIPRSQ
jgi:hypothetical protein